MENVLVSLGDEGGVLVCKEGTFSANAPKVECISTIGAGDGVIAGFIDGYIKGYDICRILRQAQRHSYK